METIPSLYECCSELRRRLKKILTVVRTEFAFAILQYYKSSKKPSFKLTKHSKLSSIITEIDVDAFEI